MHVIEKCTNQRISVELSPSSVCLVSHLEHLAWETMWRWPKFLRLHLRLHLRKCSLIIDRWNIWAAPCVVMNLTYAASYLRLYLRHFSNLLTIWATTSVVTTHTCSYISEVTPQSLFKSLTDEIVELHLQSWTSSLWYAWTHCFDLRSPNKACVAYKHSIQAFCPSQITRTHSTPGLHSCEIWT